MKIDKPEDFAGPGRYVVFLIKPSSVPELYGQYIVSRVGGFHTMADVTKAIEDTKKAFGETLGGLISPTPTKGLIFRIYEATYTEISAHDDTPVGIKATPVKRQKRVKPEPKKWGASVSYGLLTADRKRMIAKLEEAGLPNGMFNLATEAEARAYAEEVKQKCGVELHVHKHF